MKSKKNPGFQDSDTDIHCVVKKKKRNARKYQKLISNKNPAFQSQKWEEQKKTKKKPKKKINSKAALYNIISWHFMQPLCQRQENLDSINEHLYLSGSRGLGSVRQHTHRYIDLFEYCVCVSCQLTSHTNLSWWLPWFWLPPPLQQYSFDGFRYRL